MKLITKAKASLPEQMIDHITACESAERIPVKFELTDREYRRFRNELEGCPYPPASSKKGLMDVFMGVPLVVV